MTDTTTDPLAEVRKAVAAFESARNAKIEFVNDTDGFGEPSCGWGEFDEAMADFNEAIAYAGSDLSFAVQDALNIIDNKEN